MRLEIVLFLALLATERAFIHLSHVLSLHMAYQVSSRTKCLVTDRARRTGQTLALVIFGSKLVETPLLKKLSKSEPKIKTMYSQRGNISLHHYFPIYQSVLHLYIN